MDKGCVHHGEVAAHVRFDEQVLVSGFDRLRDAADVGDRRRGRDRHGVGIAHPMFRHALAQAFPIEHRRAVHLHRSTAGIRQKLNGIYRQDASRPLRTFEARIAAALGSQIAGRGNGIVRNRFHAGVREGDGFLGGIGNLERLKGILKAHQAETNRAVLHIRPPRFGNGVEIDVDDIVQHAHCRLHGAGQPFEINACVRQMI